MDTPGPAIGLCVARWRQARRLSGRALAALTEANAAAGTGRRVTHTYVKKLETGKVASPGVDALDSLARALGFPDYHAMLVAPLPGAAGKAGGAAQSRQSPPHVNKTLDVIGVAAAAYAPGDLEEVSLPLVTVAAYQWGSPADPLAGEAALRPIARLLVLPGEVAMRAGPRGYAVPVGDDSLSRWEIKRGDYCLVDPDQAPKLDHLVACRLRTASGGWRLAIRKLTARPDGARELITGGRRHTVPVPASDALLVGLVVLVVPAPFEPMESAPTAEDVEEMLASLTSHRVRRPDRIVPRAG